MEIEGIAKNMMVLGIQTLRPRKPCVCRGRYDDFPVSRCMGDKLTDRVDFAYADGMHKQTGFVRPRKYRDSSESSLPVCPDLACQAHRREPDRAQQKGQANCEKIPYPVKHLACYASDTSGMFKRHGSSWGGWYRPPVGLFFPLVSMRAEGSRIEPMNRPVSTTMVGRQYRFWDPGDPESGWASKSFD